MIAAERNGIIRGQFYLRTALLRFSRAIRVRASGVARGVGSAITPSSRTVQSTIATRVAAGSSLRGAMASHDARLSIWSRRRSFDVEV